MGVFSRLSDIVNSNITALLDRAEDPEKILRLIIQEMEDTLVEVRSSTAKLIADQKEVRRKRADFEMRQAKWADKAELAVGKGRDDLAKGALAARRKAAEMVEILDDELAEIDRSLDKANEDLAQLQAKLKEAKAKQHTLDMRRKTAKDRMRVQRQLNDGRLDDAMARFEHYERRLDELEAEAEVFTMGQPRTLAEQFDELEAEDAVETELADIKQRLAKKAKKKD
ncbi:MAG: phage shock protein PspA [Geminicoccaceae bacterium]